MFRVEVTEIFSPASPAGQEPNESVTRYTQTVDALDMKALIAAVNKVPRQRRNSKGAKPEGTA